MENCNGLEIVLYIFDKLKIVYNQNLIINYRTRLESIKRFLVD